MDTICSEYLKFFRKGPYYGIIKESSPDRYLNFSVVDYTLKCIESKGDYLFPFFSRLSDYDSFDEYLEEFKAKKSKKGIEAYYTSEGDLVDGERYFEKDAKTTDKAILFKTDFTMVVHMAVFFLSEIGSQDLGRAFCNLLPLLRVIALYPIEPASLKNKTPAMTDEEKTEIDYLNQLIIYDHEENQQKNDKPQRDSVEKMLNDKQNKEVYVMITNMEHWVLWAKKGENLYYFNSLTNVEEEGVKSRNKSLARDWFTDGAGNKPKNYTDLQQQRMDRNVGLECGLRVALAIANIHVGRIKNDNVYKYKDKVPSCVEMYDMLEKNFFDKKDMMFATIVEQFN